MSEADSTNASSISRDLTYSSSPIYVETNCTISDLPQVCIAHAENIGNCSENVLTQPNDTSVSSFRQFEPTCKFQQPEAFQTLIEGVPCTEMPELLSHTYNYEKGTNVEEQSLREENLLETSTSTNNLGDECVRQLPCSSSHCSGETLKFLETSQDKRTAMEPTLNSPKPQNFLYKESIAISSKERQNLGKTPETVNHQEEAMVEDPRTLSSWSPEGISWNGYAFQEDLKTPDTEESSESFQPPDEDMALNEVLRKLKNTNKKQKIQIQNLQYSNAYLEKKVKDLQMTTAKQQVLLDIINKLKENIEELIEDKYRVMLEKNDTDKTLQNLHEILTNTQKHLQESRNEKEALQLELKKIKSSYFHLQEKYMTEIQQKNETVSQCLEKDKTLNKKEEEVERLQEHKEKLEKVTTCTLDLLKKEKETRVHELLSLKEEFQKRERDRLQEKQELNSKIEQMIAEVKSFQCISENEKAKNTELQEQINAVKAENARLQQQVAKSEAQTPGCEFEGAQLKSHLEEAMEPESTKDTTNFDAEYLKGNEKVSDAVLQRLKSFHLKKKSLDMELLKHKAKITTFRELIASKKTLEGQIIEVTSFDSSETKTVNDVPLILGDKLNEYHHLNEELDFLIAKLGNLLESKEDYCNKLIEENNNYQRHLGNLIEKVTSYEEIIECADQRLEISHSHIVYLEERNKHLEDLIRKPIERDRKLRMGCFLITVVDTNRTNDSDLFDLRLQRKRDTSIWCQGSNMVCAQTRPDQED